MPISRKSSGAVAPGQEILDGDSVLFMSAAERAFYKADGTTVLLDLSGDVVKIDGVDVLVALALKAPLDNPSFTGTISGDASGLVELQPTAIAGLPADPAQYVSGNGSWGRVTVLFDDPHSPSVSFGYFGDLTTWYSNGASLSVGNAPNEAIRLDISGTVFAVAFQGDATALTGTIASAELANHATSPEIATIFGFFGDGLLDIGWTANADGGDKTAVVGSTATLESIATALDIVTAGAGTQLKAIGEKLKAIEAYMAANTLVNA